QILTKRLYWASNFRGPLCDVFFFFTINKIDLKISKIDFKINKKNSIISKKTS
ncbi:unnamed protein product, partial [Arabidopsis halleri]